MHLLQLGVAYLAGGILGNWIFIRLAGNPRRIGTATLFSVLGVVAPLWVRHYTQGVASLLLWFTAMIFAAMVGMGATRWQKAKMMSKDTANEGPTTRAV